MTALTVNGTGPYTGWLTATTFTSDLDESVVPEPPASLKAKASDNSITIAWNPPSSKVNISVPNPDTDFFFIGSRYSYTNKKQIFST